MIYIITKNHLLNSIASCVDVEVPFLCCITDQSKFAIKIFTRICLSDSILTPLTRFPPQLLLGLPVYLHVFPLFSLYYFHFLCYCNHYYYCYCCVHIAPAVVAVCHLHTFLWFLFSPFPFLSLCVHTLWAVYGVCVWIWIVYGTHTHQVRTCNNLIQGTTDWLEKKKKWKGADQCWAC